MLYAGIDEAGYGPMFGPMCAAVSVFEVDDSDETPCLWTTLRSVIARSRREARNGEVVIDDSKRLKAGGRQHPLTHLERGVLLFAALARKDSAWLDDVNDTSFLDSMGTESPEATWYDSTTPLPLSHDPGLLRIDLSRLDRHLQEAGVRCCHLGAMAVSAAEFNRRVATSGSKAILNFELMVSLADTCWRRADGRPMRLMVDRHGGRTHYLDDLGAAWPQAKRQILREDQTESWYRLTRMDRGPLEIRFVTGGDREHLPVALASMTAKYVRELLMIRLNRWFHLQDPTLKPTAGYVADGRRFLQDIQPIICSENLDPAELVRSC